VLEFALLEILAMPLFEYRCQACAHLEEVLQKHGEPPPDACPACGKTGTFEKEVSLTSFQLKGGGWYKDLYSSTSESKDGKKEGSTKSESSSSTAAASTTPSSKAAESASAAPASTTAASSGGSGSKPDKAA
jgi:putative FmdB family regulatory protein